MKNFWKVEREGKVRYYGYLKTLIDLEKLDYVKIYNQVVRFNRSGLKLWVDKENDIKVSQISLEYDDNEIISTLMMNSRNYKKLVYNSENVKIKEMVIFDKKDLLRSEVKAKLIDFGFTFITY